MIMKIFITLYLIIDKLDEYIDENNGRKYLVFDLRMTTKKYQKIRRALRQDQKLV